MTSERPALSLSEIWSQILAPKFIQHRHVLMSGAEPHGRRAMMLYGPEGGADAIDIGCGFGDATVELAELVVPSGSTLGLDLVEAFIGLAREMARARDLPRLRFVAT